MKAGGITLVYQRYFLLTTFKKRKGVFHFWGEFENLPPRTPSSQRFFKIFSARFVASAVNFSRARNICPQIEMHANPKKYCKNLDFVILCNREISSLRA
jgi:hypothetical protein